MKTDVSYIIFIGFGAIYICLGAYFLIKAHTAMLWPKTSASLKHCELSEDYDESPIFQTTVCYSYIVNGTQHNGYTIYHGYKGTGSYEPHKAFYEHLKDALTVEVRYNPANPEDSVLTYGLSRQHLSFIIFGGIFVLMAGAGALYSFSPNTLDSPIYWCAVIFIFLSGIIAFVKLLASIEDNILQKMNVLVKKAINDNQNGENKAN